MDDSDTGAPNTPQIIVLLPGIVISLCTLLILVIWKGCLQCRGCLDIRKRCGGGRKPPKQGGDEEIGLAAANNDVALYSLPHDRYDRTSPAIAQPNEAHTRSHQTGMTRQSAPNPDARRPLWQLPRHQEANNTSTTRPNQAAIRALQTQISCPIAEAPSVPYSPHSPTHTVLRHSHTNTNVHFRSTSTNSEPQDHPIGDGQRSPELPRVEAQPPRLHTPRFSRQAFVFDPNMTISQSAGEDNDVSEVHAAEAERLSGVEDPEEEVEKPSTRVPSYVSENPPPSYRIEPSSGLGALL